MKIKIKHYSHALYRTFTSWEDVFTYITSTMSFKFESELGRLSDKHIMHFGLPEEGKDNPTVVVLKALLRQNNMTEYHVKYLEE